MDGLISRNPAPLADLDERGAVRSVANVEVLPDSGVKLLRQNVGRTLGVLVRPVVGPLNVVLPKVWWILDKIVPNPMRVKNWWVLPLGHISAVRTRFRVDAELYSRWTVEERARVHRQQGAWAVGATLAAVLSFSAGNHLPWLCLGAFWWARPTWDVVRWVLGYPQIRKAHKDGEAPDAL